ncbi:MAG: TRAM domain-containing protein [Spirochaetia bacterium]|nr:TRAM domain-containing protein [Spirochaetia bacterium]
METARLEIEKIISNSCGLARNNGKAVFIPDTLPGETVLAEITDAGSGYSNGALLEIIDPSPHRVTPPCSYYGICGGCTMQHSDYEYQLEIRKSLVIEALLRNGKTVFNDVKSLSGSPYGYRCRAQFHAQAGSLQPGFKKRNSSEIVGIDSCMVCTSSINKFLEERRRMRGKRVTLFAPENICYQTGESVNTDGAQISVPVNGKIIKTDINCFFQSNLEMLQKTIPLILDHLWGESFFDLYCGVGVFGAFLAERGESLVSVESDKNAVKFARGNIKNSARESQALKTEFYAMTAESFISRWNSVRGRSLPDTVVADPPRSGISNRVKEFIVKNRIKKLIYLSCDYGTLGRDIGFFTRNRYNLENLYFLDFYPQTAHAESLAVLEYMG